MNEGSPQDLELPLEPKVEKDFVRERKDYLERFFEKAKGSQDADEVSSPVTSYCFSCGTEQTARRYVPRVARSRLKPWDRDLRKSIPLCVIVHCSECGATSRYPQYASRV